MVWSEQIGGSIVLPSSAQPGTGKPYLVIGDSVPSEIANAFSAAIVFWSGIPDAASAGAGGTPVIYWALGITTSGALELVAFFAYNYNASTGTATFARQTIFSAYRDPSGVGKLFLDLATSQGSFNESPATVMVTARKLGDTGWVPLTTANGGNLNGWTTTGLYYRIVDGMCHINGACSFTGTWAAGKPMAILPIAARPSIGIFAFASWGGSTSTYEVDITTAGNVQPFGSAAIGGLVFESSWPIG